MVDEDKISTRYVNGLLISQYPKRRKLNRNLLE
nr:hypothetical protein [uncultured Flavobacterium sp.]